MLTAYWAAKGGAGATALAAAHGILSAESRPTLLVDLDGDLPAVLGLQTTTAGIADWLAAGDDVPADAIERLIVPVTTNLHLLTRGDNALAPGRASTLGHVLAEMPRTVVVDAGTRPGPAAAAIVRCADRSVLVTRACYLAVRRAQAAPLAPSEIAVVRERQRALSARDVEAALGVPVRTSVALDPTVARAIDAGLLARRLPRPLRRPLSGADR